MGSNQAHNIPKGLKGQIGPKEAQIGLKFPKSGLGLSESPLYWPDVGPNRLEMAKSQAKKA